MDNINDGNWKVRYIEEESEESWIRFYKSTVKGYVAKIEVLRIILGFNGNMEDQNEEE